MAECVLPCFGAREGSATNFREQLLSSVNEQSARVPVESVMHARLPHGSKYDFGAFIRVSVN